MSDPFDPGFDDEFDMAAADAVEKARLRLRREGVGAAVAALIEVARDRKAPAPARATAGSALLRAAGFFEKSAFEADDKPPEEMSAAEISASLRRIQLERRELAERQAQLDEQVTVEPDPSEGGLFD